jgi:Tol biopolymer transport system component
MMFLLPCLLEPGKQIAYPQIQPGDALGGINLFDRDSGKIRILTFADKAIGEMTWSPDGDGLFVIYHQKGPNYNRRQIGYVALADGQLCLISRDTNSYATLSLSADGKMLATVQQKAVSNFYVLPGNGSTSADISSSGSAMTSRHAHYLRHIQGIAVWSSSRIGRSIALHRTPVHPARTLVELDAVPAIA